MIGGTARIRRHDDRGILGIRNDKLSGNPFLASSPPALPVTIAVEFRALANWPTFPLARKFLKVVLARSAAGPNTLVPLIVPCAVGSGFVELGGFNTIPFRIWSNNRALPPARVMLKASEYRSRKY